MPKLTEAPRVPDAAFTEPRYLMEIAWSDEDEVYVVTVPDLPGCMTHGATYVEAARMGEDAIAAWIEGARHWERPIPEPHVARHPAKKESPASAVVLPGNEEVWNFLQTVVRFMPDVQNLPPVVLESFRPLVDVYRRRSPEDQVTVRRVTESQELAFAILDVVGRAMVAHGDLTGKALPAFPSPDVGPDRG